LYKTALADQQGHFEIRGVPPGEYKLLAFEVDQSSPLKNADILGRYESRAVAATVAAGIQSRVEINLIPNAP
jgi:hypothetical protein